jgi:hypothetical protein
VFALPMIGVVEGPAKWGAVRRSVAGSFLLFDNCIWFFWKLIVLGYLWMALCWALCAVCFCLVAMSGGVGCAVGAWADVPLGVFVLGILAWCLVVWGWLRSNW